MMQMMKRIEALEDLLDQDNEYHFDSNTYSDNWIWKMEIVCNKSWKYNLLIYAYCYIGDRIEYIWKP